MLITCRPRAPFRSASLLPGLSSPARPPLRSLLSLFSRSKSDDACGDLTGDVTRVKSPTRDRKCRASNARPVAARMKLFTIRDAFQRTDVARSIDALRTPVDISRKPGSARARDIGDIGTITLISRSKVRTVNRTVAEENENRKY